MVHLLKSPQQCLRRGCARDPIVNETPRRRLRLGVDPADSSRSSQSMSTWVPTHFQVTGMIPCTYKPQKRIQFASSSNLPVHRARNLIGKGKGGEKNAVPCVLPDRDAKRILNILNIRSRLRVFYDRAFPAGTNNAFVTMQLGKERFQTSVAKERKYPEWSEECELYE